MGSRRIRPLTVRDLDKLPQHDQTQHDQTQFDRDETWHAWAEEVTREWGSCGVMAVNGGRVIGYLLLAPSDQLPKSSEFASGTSRDAAVVLTAYVVEEHRGHGVGRQLIQSAAATAIRRSCRALEAFGANLPGSTPFAPVSWLTAVGFEISRPHPITPKLRMELRSTVRWRVDLNALLGRITGLVTRPAPPEPANYELVLSTTRREATHTEGTDRPVTVV